MNLVNKLCKHSEFGFEIVGFLDDRVSDRIYNTEVNLPILGKIAEVDRIVHLLNVDIVIIALPIKAYEKIRNVVKLCDEEGVRVDIIPDFFEIIEPTAPVYEIDGLPLLSVRNTPMDSPAYQMGKRVFDFAFSLLILVILSPLFLIMAVGIKLSSPGPIFFKQERIGANRKNFQMFKFRTMKLQHKEQSDTVWTTKDDNRSSKFGNFLRKTSLDELPQFFNVLRGEMSVVGPRPERPFFAKKFKTEIPKYMVRHQVKPGITGYAQINGWRGDTSIEKRLESDLYYMRNWSFGFDMKIISKTILKGWINENAY